MLREAKLTRGIGVRIAHNTPCISTKDALIDRILTSVTNAKQKKTTKIAQHKDLTSHGLKTCRFQDPSTKIVADFAILEKSVLAGANCIRI